jgi:hypothetical protein
MRDVSLKFVRNAHPGAVIGADKRGRESAYKGRVGHVLEQKLSPGEHERPFDTARMTLQGLLYCLGRKPCTHRKVSSI